MTSNHTFQQCFSKPKNEALCSFVPIIAVISNLSYNYVRLLRCQGVLIFFSGHKSHLGTRIFEYFLCNCGVADRCNFLRSRSSQLVLCNLDHREAISPCCYENQCNRVQCGLYIDVVCTVNSMFVKDFLKMHMVYRETGSKQTQKYFKVYSIWLWWGFHQT